MTEQTFYPQLPAAIWWGFREILKNKPRIQLSPKIISVQFGVQDTAAKAYIRELQRLGMLDEECRPTELALKWRLDDDYSQAVKDILKFAYPEDLLDTVDVNDLDRTKAKQWFEYDGLGSGAAGNKASTLALIASNSPGETSKQVSAKSERPSRRTKSVKKVAGDHPVAKSVQMPSSNEVGQGIPLNINIQIHISADSSSSQIETIFKSMKKYLSNEDVE